MRISQCLKYAFSLALVWSFDPCLCRGDCMVHVFYVASTASPDIDRDMESNLFYLQQPFILGLPDASYDPHEIKGLDATQQKILDQIEMTPVSDQDVIVFVYCGHGEFDEESNGTVLVVTNENGEEKIPLKLIRTALKGRGARLTVSIADCCNVMNKGGRLAAAPAKTERQDFSPLLNELFLKTSGDISIESSAPGEYALCGVPTGGFGGGSLFSVILGKWMAKNLDEPIAWEELIKSVRSKVAEDFEKLASRPGGIRLGPNNRLLEQKTQTVWATRNDEEWISSSAAE